MSTIALNSTISSQTLGRPLRIGLLGCGRIAQRHIEAIQANQGTTIAMVCDCIPQLAEKTASRLNAAWVTNMTQMQGLDAISVLTPSGKHPRHCIEVAKHCDAPIIICEKPLSLTVREALEMIREVEQYGKILLPVYQNRYNPLIAYMHDLIHSKKLGTIYQFTCNVFWNRNDDYFRNGWHGTADLDGGVLYTQASHYVDMIHFFFGEINQTKGLGASLRGYSVQDTISAVCEFKNGVIGSINATVNTHRQNYVTEFTLIAEKGTIRLSGTNLNQINFWDVEGLEKPDMDFKINHIYGKGHDTMYQYLAEGRHEMFPSKEDVLSGIALMQRLSY